VLDADTARTRNHIERLEQIFALIDEAPDLSMRPRLADALARIDTFAASIEDPDVRDAAILSVLYTGRHQLCALYAMLAAWARRLSLREASAILGVIIEEEKAALLPAASANEPGATPSQPKISTVGERLTALFDRNRKREP
jgi:ferritin-like metal-binding protein YciE